MDTGNIYYLRRYENRGIIAGNDDIEEKMRQIMLKLLCESGVKLVKLMRESNKHVDGQYWHTGMESLSLG